MISRIFTYFLIVVFFTSSAYAEQLDDRISSINQQVSNVSSMVTNSNDFLKLIDSKKISTLRKLSGDISKRIDNSLYVKNIQTKGIINKISAKNTIGINTLAKKVNTLDSNIRNLKSVKVKFNSTARQIARIRNKSLLNKVSKTAGVVGKATYAIDMAQKTGVLLAKYKEGSLDLKDSLEYTLDTVSIVDKFFLLAAARKIEKDFEMILEKKKEINSNLMNVLEIAREDVNYFSKDAIYVRLNNPIYRKKLSNLTTADELLSVISSAKQENIDVLERIYNGLGDVENFIKKRDTGLFQFQFEDDKKLQKAMLAQVDILKKIILSNLTELNKPESNLLYANAALSIKAGIDTNGVKDIIENEYSQTETIISETDIAQKKLEKLIKDTNNEIEYANQIKQPKLTQPIDENTNTDLTNQTNIDIADNQSPTPDDESDTTPGDDDLATLPNLGYVAGKATGSASLFTSNLYTGLEGGGDAPNPALQAARKELAAKSQAQQRVVESLKASTQKLESLSRQINTNQSKIRLLEKELASLSGSSDSSSRVSQAQIREAKIRELRLKMFWSLYNKYDGDLSKVSSNDKNRLDTLAKSFDGSWKELFVDAPALYESAKEERIRLVSSSNGSGSDKVRTLQNEIKNLRTEVSILANAARKKETEYRSLFSQYQINKNELTSLISDINDTAKEDIASSNNPALTNPFYGSVSYLGDGATTGTFEGYFAASTSNEFSSSNQNTSFRAGNAGEFISPDISTGSGNHFTDGYQYVAWGQWNSNGHQIVEGMDTNNALGGYWVLGQQAYNVPTQGSATYSGDMRGDYINSAGNAERGAIGGTIGLNVNFGQNTIAGNGNLTLRGTPLDTFSFNPVNLGNVPSSDVGGIDISHWFYTDQVNTGSGQNMDIAGSLNGDKGGEMSGGFQWGEGNVNSENSASGIFTAKCTGGACQ